MKSKFRSVSMDDRLPTVADIWAVPEEGIQRPLRAVFLDPDARTPTAPRPWYDKDAHREPVARLASSDAPAAVPAPVDPFARPIPARPPYIAPAASGDHSHTWRWAGSYGSVPESVPLPWWDFSRCTSPTILRCTDCEHVMLVACKSQDAAACRPCEQRYRRKVRTIAREPLVLARPGTAFFLTLTAPGERVHCLTHTYIDNDGNRRPSVKCDFGDGQEHEPCPCTREDAPGEADTVHTALTSYGRRAEWNRTAVARYNDLITDLRRSIEGLQGFDYFRAAEVQDRGVLHFHILLIVRHGIFVVKEPAKEHPGTKAEILRYVIRHGFGHEMDLQQVEHTPEAQVKAARYVAKYVSKSNEDAQRKIARPVFSEFVPADAPARTTVNPRTAELIEERRAPRILRERLLTDEIDEHEQTLPTLPQNLTGRRRFRFRTWSASRGWGLNLARVELLQRLWATEGSAVSQAQLHAWLTPENGASPPV